jgi:hypothetical protein
MCQELEKDQEGYSFQNKAQRAQDMLWRQDRVITGDECCLG